MKPLDKKVEIFKNIDLHVVSHDNEHFQVLIENRRKKTATKVLENVSITLIMAIIHEIKKVKRSMLPGAVRPKNTETMAGKLVKNLIKKLKKEA